MTVMPQNSKTAAPARKRRTFPFIASTLSFVVFTFSVLVTFWFVSFSKTIAPMPTLPDTGLTVRVPYELPLPRLPTGYPEFPQKLGLQLTEDDMRLLLRYGVTVVRSPLSANDILQKLSDKTAPIFVSSDLVLDYFTQIQDEILAQLPAKERVRVLNSLKSENWILAGIDHFQAKYAKGWMQSPVWDAKLEATRSAAQKQLDNLRENSLLAESVRGAQSSRNQMPDASPVFERNLVYLEPSPLLYENLGLAIKAMQNLEVINGAAEKRLDALVSFADKLKDISKTELRAKPLDHLARQTLRDFLVDYVAQDFPSFPQADFVLITELIGEDYKLFLGPVAPARDAVLGAATRAEAFENRAIDMDEAFLRGLNANFDCCSDYELLKQKAGTVRIPVFMYHHIAASPTRSAARRYYVRPAVFERQVAYLVAKGYHFLTPAEFIKQYNKKKNPARKSVLMTFDDGPYDNYKNAYRILKKYHVTGTFYITAKYSGIPLKKLREMAKKGMVIDSHTMTHRDLRKLSTKSLRYEILNSKVLLESVTKKKIFSLAYPGCTVDDRGKKVAAGAGYKLGFSCGTSIDHRAGRRFWLSRVHAYESMAYFKSILAGYWYQPAY